MDTRAASTSYGNPRPPMLGWDDCNGGVVVMPTIKDDHGVERSVYADELVLATDARAGTRVLG